MFSKRFVMSAVAASLVIMPGARAVADIGDGIVGGLVGGAVSGIIVNESAKARERKRTTTTTTRTRTIYKNAPVNSARRAEVRETQVALNYFGFPAGTPDGVTGRNTRNAVAQYQGHMGYPVSGYLNDYERQFLVGSYYRAQSSGVATTQLIAQRGQGTRGLLHAYRDEAAGTPNYTTTGGTGVTQATVAPAAPATSAPSVATFATAAPTEAAPEQSQTSLLPNLMGSQDNGRSLASHCNQVSLLTNSNGGFVTEASISDPRFALNEQFCLARTYAIASGEKLAGSLQGVSNSQLEEQCRAFGPAMRDQVAALSLKNQADVMQDVRGFILDAGMPPAQLAGTARICLSVGYRTDNMDVALGSALLLTALGEGVYGELMGHHLSEGFGTAKRPDLALAWYQAGFDAVDRGAEPVFAPGNPGRNTLIQKAAYQLNGIPSGQAAGSTEGAVQPASTLPSFNIAQ